MWLGDRPIAGAADAVARLLAAGRTVRYCTNNSSTTLGDYRAKLTAHGLPTEEVLTSATAVATMVAPGERVLVCADSGVVEALEEVGAEVVRAGAPGSESAGDPPVDSVVVGFHRHFDYAAMRRATRAVLAGARLLATNDDPRYPDADGPAPGNGAILASIETATGQRAVIAGKPHRPMVDLVLGRSGRGDGGPVDGIVVGDSPGTDGALAAALGWPFGLVLSGNTAERGDHAGPWATDLAALVDRALGSP